MPNGRVDGNGITAFASGLLSFGLRSTHHPRATRLITARPAATRERARATGNWQLARIQRENTCHVPCAVCKHIWCGDPRSRILCHFFVRALFPLEWHRGCGCGWRLLVGLAGSWSWETHGPSASQQQPAASSQARCAPLQRRVAGDRR
jgi:hypothetical protein